MVYKDERGQYRVEEAYTLFVEPLSLWLLHFTGFIAIGTDFNDLQLQSYKGGS